MKLPATDWKELRSALCAAFPSRREIGRLLGDHFGQNIEEIASYDGTLVDAADDIIRWFSARDKIPDLINAAFLERPANATLRGLAQKWTCVPSLPEQDHLERIFNQANSPFHPESWYVKFKDVVNQVCQIEVKTRSGGTSFGTGFLVERDIVLTNYHVIERVAEPERFQAEAGEASPADVIIRFDNRKGTSGYINPGVEFGLSDDWLLASSPYHPQDLRGTPDWGQLIEDELDYAFLRVQGAPGEQELTQGEAGSKRGWVRLKQRPVRVTRGMGLIVVQHPEGEALKVGIDTEAVLDINPSGTRIKHKANTARGSSGAPCFSLSWDLVAIHQAGVASTESVPGYNVAIPISKIIQSIQDKGLSDHFGLLT